MELAIDLIERTGGGLVAAVVFTHSLSDCAVQPIFAAIGDTAAQRDRTARARTSAENLFVVLLMIAPPT
ncbi:hypothetical protein [Tepidamorphus gemmatus]|uniref:hypothetical protein n=1 Tax=Tepidamorphus gemmatus TaxID=747076 RepID=UPI001404530D|nr:hypothetical protein [Tepidamorphus gemmatus]